MSSAVSHKKFWPFKSIHILLFLSFLLWIFSFRGFIFGEVSFVYDSISYYDHINFYVDTLSRGVFPLWDPVWNCGAPNEFFLRRMGAYNPFFLLLFLFRLAGLSFKIAYPLFLSIYYFIGGLSFYFLAKRIFGDTRTAFVAFLLLMFSSLGTRMIDSYILFTAIPILLFFYFLVAFTQNPQKHFLLGVTLSLMILMTTYIPFYFVTIFFSFLLCYAVIYFKDLKSVFFRYLEFIKRNKILTGLCLFALALSLVPGIKFFLASRQAEYVLPLRHSNLAAPSMLEVDPQWIKWWGILEDIYFSRFFSDLRKLEYAVLYIPVFAYLLLPLGLFTKINKKIVLLAAWGSLLFLMSIPTTSFYDFLHSHIFFFKYFRNLHFFLWLIILPIFILFIAEQLRLFLECRVQSNKQKIGLIIYIFLAHCAVAGFIYREGDVLGASYLTIVLSFIFFVLSFSGFFNKRVRLILPLLLLLVVIQPLAVYHYFIGNSEKQTKPDVYGIRSYLNFSFTRYQMTEDLAARTDLKFQKNSDVEKEQKYVYYGTKWYNFLSLNLNYYVLNKYIWPKFIVYDRIKWIDDKTLNFREVERAFFGNQNLVFISSDSEEPGTIEAVPKYNPQALIIEENSDYFEVLDFDVNSVKIRTNFDSKKFLVYNDSFHSGWKAFVNGKETDVFRANVAFKGVRLPPGENIVRFQFGEKGDHLLNFFLLAVFYGVFGGFMVLGIQSLRTTKTGS